jgi:hypothetical protein
MKNNTNTNTNTDTLPKLTCLVTGKTRTSNIKYLEAKALRLGVNVDVLINNYVVREAIKLLRQGKSFDEIRSVVSTAEGFKPSSATITNEELIRLNSKGSSKS